MAVKTILPTTNLHWVDVRDTLNANGGTVNDNYTNAFKESSNINMWSKHKPVKSLQLFPTTYDYLKEAKYGLEEPRLHHPVQDGNIINGVWQYNIPSADTDAKRLGDYRNYNPKAIPCVKCIFPSSIGMLNTNLMVDGSLYVSLDDSIEGFDPNTMVNFRDFATAEMLDCYLCVGMFYKNNNTLNTFYISSKKKISEYINSGEYGRIIIENFTKAMPSWFKSNINVVFKLFLINQDVSSGAIDILDDRSYSLECELNTDRRTIYIKQIAITDYLESTVEFTVEKVSSTTARFSRIVITSRRTNTVVQGLVDYRITGGNDWSVNTPILATGQIQFDNNDTWTREYQAGELNSNSFEIAYDLHIFYIDVRTGDNTTSIASKEETINF